MEYTALLLSFVTVVILTPLVKQLAFRIGAVDVPDQRKVHKGIMPRLGGLAIYISFMVWLLTFAWNQPYTIYLFLGGTMIMLVGLLDDIKGLSPKVKMAGQILAAGIITAGIQIEYIILPYDLELKFGLLSVPLTILWIVAITNAINLIDGLDGLASGVSAIALITISGLAITMGNTFSLLIGLILLGSTLGFLLYNFHPAKIFLGDTGSLFLGFMISVLSILGFKNVTMFSIVVPMIILGVPIADTFFAMVRRLVKNQPITVPDKFHMHHCLIHLGYSHRKTVFIIYMISAIFGLAAVIMTKAALWLALTVLAALILFVEVLVELTGLIDRTYRPILNLITTSRIRR
ncbi:UDP-GlcNAc:undecaprenyl-phosphate GlcNAc-1-phosphate transferase [Thalassobacillus cyri]|uniref:UDP-GlcNAc:undecaprenyl-phosphate GlcNAc-1-phosphate transferase n=1 Tax=Thalassobacillus cyri TaxID=571932 RepID=A0A1H4DVF6_9BACI|nr:MraY family glycosyltransferase [Thalassobacillus cyri]SEA76785.1 UDP-GlcNAc:undecaprenyl-phosphate GlcNAc-1-phosphate transferase [Thalassobacillus cyri]